MVTDKCLQLCEKHKPENYKTYGAVNSRANAVKGLVELAHGNLESGTANPILPIYVLLF